MRLHFVLCAGVSASGRVERGGGEREGDDCQLVQLRTQQLSSSLQSSTVPLPR